MSDKNQLEILEFTDPVCTWCWGSEPILRKIETRYGSQVKIGFIMGGLVKDIKGFVDIINGIGVEVDRSNRQIIKHWLEASRKHGMPVKADGFELLSEEYNSTYPQNIAYKAAQMESREKADRFLRRIREATAAESRKTNRPEVLKEIAEEAGLDVARFEERISDGSAYDEFMKDLEKTNDYGITGFPSFLVRYGDDEMIVKGYQSFDTFRSIIRMISDGEIQDSDPEVSEESVLRFITHYGRTAPVEIRESFGLSGDETEELIEALEKKGQVRRIGAGNGFFVEPLQD